MNHFHKYNLQLLLHLREKKHSEGGYSLVIALASILLLGTLLVTAALVSKVDSSSTAASTNSNSGFYAAEAGLNIQAKGIRDKFIGFNRPSGVEPISWENCTDSSGSNDGSGDFACDTSLTINGQQIVTFVDDITENSAISVTIQDGVFKGLNAQEYRYDLVSTAVETESGQQTPSSILGLRFKSRLVPLFQFAAFYDQDLDVFAPPTMTLNGRVHSNNNLFLNSGFSTLDITGVVSAGGKLFHGEKWTDWCIDTVRIADKNDNLQTLPGCEGTRVTYSQADVQNTWDGRIFIEDEELKLPDISNYQMPPSSVIGNAQEVEDNHVYWDKSDLRLVLNLSSSGNPSSIQVVNSNGTENAGATSTLNSCTPASTTLTSDATADTVTINVDSTSGFSVGDPIQIGSDFDSNVIASIPNNNTIVIKRRLGHSYQGTNIANTGDTVKKAIAWTSDTFYNFREKGTSTGNDAGRFIRMLNLDVGEFLNCIDANVGTNGLMGNKELNEESEGGMVWFLAVDGPNSHVDVSQGDSPNNYGVRVYNGDNLSSTNSGAETVKGLTIVTDQAMYIQGDYNSSGTKKPASFITDTLNILSTAWTLTDERGYDYDSATNLQTTPTYIVPQNGYFQSPKEANDTTINAAFFAGIDLTGGSNESTSRDLGFDSSGGGVNNYPRMHEEWTLSFLCPEGGLSYGKCDLTIKGSLVSFGAATRVNGDYCGSHHDGCNIYHPPARFWSYDTDFNQAQNLPPLTPRAVYVTQEIFERDFTYTSSNPIGPFNDKFKFALNREKLLVSTETSKFKTSFRL